MKAKLSLQLLIILLLSSMAFAQEWTADTRVTSTPSQTQDVVAVSDGQGFIHAVATESGSLQNVFYFKMDNLGSLVDARQISMTTGNARQPAVAIDLSGNRHFVWADAQDVNGQYRVLYSKLDATGNLVIERRVVSDAAVIDSPQIVVDRQNNAHIVWSDFRNGNWEIYYEKIGADGTTLVDDRRLTNAPGTSFNPTMFYDSTSFLQQIHVAFEDNRDLDAEIYYMKLDIAGNVLSEVRVTNARGRSLTPSVAGDNGDAYIVYTDYRVGNYPELYLSRVDSRNAVLERQITSNLGWPLQPSITMLPRDNEAYIVWEDHQHGNAEIYYSKRDGEHLTGNNVRLTNQQAHSAGPVIVADPSALHAFWQDMRDGNWEIYHKVSVSPQQMRGSVVINGKPRRGGVLRFNLANGLSNENYIFVLATSEGSTPLGNGVVLGLNYDEILRASFATPSVVGLVNSQGALNEDGTGEVILNIPNRPALVGQRFYGAAVYGVPPRYATEAVGFTVLG